MTKGRKTHEWFEYACKHCGALYLDVMGGRVSTRCNGHTPIRKKTIMLTASSQVVEVRLKQVNELFDGDPADMMAEVLSDLGGHAKGGAAMIDRTQ